MPLQSLQNPGVYTEVSALQGLKGQLRNGSKEAIKEVSRQFEAIFMQMMISGMRKTIEVSEEYGEDKSMYYDLFDKQVAMELAGNGGIGLAKFLTQHANIEVESEPQSVKMPAAIHQVAVKPEVVRQDKTHDAMAIKPTHVDNTTSAAISEQPIQVKQPGKAEAQKIESESINIDNPKAFVESLWNLAKDLIVENGLNPKAIIAQAALETGWGKHIMKTRQGESSNNLFGIKSDARWDGKHVVANTLEFRDGVMAQSRENFRSYDSIKDSVSDYISFMKGNERYKSAVNNAENPEIYATELHKAGYATDPDYAKKIIGIMNGKEFKNFFKSMEI